MFCKNVDVLKFFFCLCVVAIHSHALADFPPNVNYYVTQLLFRLAVPFFFVCSGYFLMRKVNENREKIDNLYKRYIKRLLFPLLSFSIINIILKIVQESSYMSGAMIFKEIIKHVVFYPWGALWFIQACIVGMMLLYPFIRRNKVHVALLFGIVLYAWALLCNNYFFVVQGSVLELYVRVFLNQCISARNGIFVGFVYLAIGCFVAVKKMSLPHFVFLCVVMICYVAEVVALKSRASLDDSALYISQLIVVPLILTRILFANA